METTERNSSNLTWILASLIGLGIAGGLYWSNNRALTRQFDQAEQRADSLLSVKFQLEGDNRDLKKQLETATDENEYLDKRLQNVHEQVSQRDQTVTNLRRSNTSQTRTIRNLSQNISRLSIVRDSLENQMAAMDEKINWQSQSNALLRKQNRDLEQQRTDLDTRLVTMVPRSAVTGDDFLVEVNKPNNKVTSKAKKANTLTVSLNVPAALKLEGMQEVYLSLTNEQQQPMMSVHHKEVVTLPDVNEMIPVHATQAVNFARNPQRISFTVTPESRVKPGRYRASIFTKDAYLGSVEFQLRDSFLFF